MTGPARGPIEPAKPLGTAVSAVPDDPLVLSAGGVPPAAFPIVGIGASAGGLAAFEAFFSGMPADVETGMAFVLVQHLSPNHESILVDLVRRYTRMEVFEVEDGMVVQPDCAYVIPPNRDMTFRGGILQLREPPAARGLRQPIDLFFRSLAEDQGDRAIGIVLSGTGSDGAQGARAIKGEGGMVMAQTPESTEYDGMPRSAIATGVVDYTLPPAEMPAQLMAYVASAGTARMPAIDPIRPMDEASLQRIFLLLRSQTGHDFSGYKPSTIHRRMLRRLAVHRVDTLADYARFLQETPSEVETLFRDLLIGVTSFFRDPAAFSELQDAIPMLFRGKRMGSVIRAWSPGCSTGEEAYSIAILIAEHLDTIRQGHTVQVFATDIDGRAIATARAGRYPLSIAADVSPERLERFFVAEPDGSGFRVHKGIRDMLVFSEQDVIKHPPFSRVDLISCRNVLIYLGPGLQHRLIPVFHYALNPGGMLFLGTSETVGEFDDLFAALNRSSKLYQRKEAAGSAPVLPRAEHIPPAATVETGFPRRRAATAVRARSPLRELAEQALLDLVAPAGALVDERGDILYLHGRTGMYLEPAAGAAGVSNILKMAREGLRTDLAAALRESKRTGGAVRRNDVLVKTNGDFTAVSLAVSPAMSGPAQAADRPLYMVLLEPAPVPATAPGGLPRDARDARGPEGEVEAPDAEMAARIAALQQEMRTREGYLQSTNEEFETSVEELRSSNEELQSLNEELQSLNEELETSKEELQSLNEELDTVNAELQSKVSDLSWANTDLANMLAGTGVGSVFVDRRLRILRFTPSASRIINVIAGDVGRPIRDLASSLVGYDGLAADAQAVLDRLVPVVAEVEARDGNWYSMRIQPYRTLDDVIEGVVITFVDITEMQRTREALRTANEQMRLAVVVRDAHDAVTVQDLDGRTLAWNPGAVRIYGWSEAAALQMNVQDRIPEGLRDGALATLHQLSRSQVLEPYLTQRLASDGSVVEVSIISTALLDATGKMYAIATTERAGGR